MKKATSSKPKTMNATTSNGSTTTTTTPTTTSTANQNDIILPPFITPCSSINDNEMPLKLLASNQISLTEIVEKNGEVYEQKSDNKFVVGIVTHLVRKNQSNQSPFFSNFYNQKKKEQSKNKPYDRMIMFVDVTSSHGQCGVIIFYSPNEAQTSLTLVRKSDCGILPGMPIAIIEPSFNGLFLGNHGDMPILTDLRQNTIIPLNKKIFKSIYHIHYPIIAPSDQVVSRAFFYEKVYVNINHVDIEKSNCTGRLCDRIEHENSNSSCFCFSTGSAQSLVMSCYVYVYLDKERTEHPIYVNHKFQSYQFTLMLTDTVIFDMTMTGEETIRYKIKLREYVARYVSHVNQNKGWSIMGWYRNARKADAHTSSDNKNFKSDDDKNTIVSEYVEPHIVTLIPRQYPLKNFEEPSFSF